jgi:curved DNA-binding protein CbpA
MERDDLRKYHELLGIDERSPSVRIQKAFIRKALKNHPDKHPGEPTELFQRICAAYWKGDLSSRGPWH